MTRQDDLDDDDTNLLGRAAAGASMIGGIDLGGTKIEARLFDRSFEEVSRHRIPTPTDSYAALLGGLADQIRWLEAQGDITAIGLGSPGLINPRTGVMLAANLPASGQSLAADISTKAGRAIPLLNDARAFTLSEATQGAGAGHANVIGLAIGTGVAGGHAINGHLIPDLNGQSGEIGHLPLPAAFVARYNVPLVTCGCGLTGCFETYLSGPGLQRLAQHMTGQVASPRDILADMPNVRAAWLRLAGMLAGMITRTHDPDVIVLGGGLGMAARLPEDLAQAMIDQTLAHTDIPLIRQAKFGDASGARGAAIYAKQMQEVGT